MQELTINPDFKQLIPPLTADEYTQLEQNIIAEGCREPIIVWNNTIIDGHNRYEICTKHDISFEVVEKDFEDDVDAKIWIIKNQFGRSDFYAFKLTALPQNFIVASNNNLLFKNAS